jgi:hypothetical protein
MAAVAHAAMTVIDLLHRLRVMYWYTAESYHIAL